MVVPGATSAALNFPGLELPKVWEGVSYKSLVPPALLGGWGHGAGGGMEWDS